LATLISILVVFIGLILIISFFPIRLSLARFYVLGAFIYYPIYWMIGLILVGDSALVSNPFLISLFLLAHVAIFVITTILLWRTFGLEGRFLYAKNQVKTGNLDWLLLPMAGLVYGTTLYRVYAYGFLVSGVVPIDGIEIFAELPYWDTILLSLQGFMFPLIIIWPMLRLSFIRENRSSESGAQKFRLLLLLAFLLSLTWGRSALITFLLFIFLFSISFSSINLKSLIKKSVTGLLIISVAAPSFYALRLTLNDEVGDLNMLGSNMLTNIGERTFDIIGFTDDIIGSNTVGNGGPYLLNSYKRLTPSYLLTNCTSYDCPAKVPLEKAVLNSMNQRDTDKPETLFIATLVDKSLVTFLFYPLVLGFLMAIELLIIAKITHRNSIYFMLAYCHLGYSLLKIEADAAWFLFHIRDSLLLFALLYVFAGILKMLRRIRFYNKHSL
jgi:hypothetical protein